MKRFRYLRFVALVGLCLCMSIEARANLIIATPSGLNPGDQFRIVFLTAGTTQATSSDIGYNNAFVSNDAISQAGGSGNNVVYGSTVLTWKAIASTYDASAISNIGSFGVPVYTASGTRITPSDTGTGLWSGSLLAPINQFLTSPFPYNTGVWTGTLPNGSAAGSFTLGSNSGFGSTPGMSSKTNSEWVETGATPSGFTNNMYGISQVLTAVPEPSTYAMALAGLACGFPISSLMRTTTRLSRRRHWSRTVSGSQEARTTTGRAGGHSRCRPAKTV